ncbi:MAG: type II secretion system F family protein [Thermoguttaceae bacterium]|jgi:tight adherence protein B
MDNLTAALGCLLIGLAAALGAYSGSSYFAWGLDALERDFADKLRRLRTRLPALRKWLIAWVATIAAAVFGLWIGMGNLILGLTVGALLLCVPWYGLRQVAERFRQRIEDQLADAMVMLANAVRAGLSLTQSLDLLATQCPKPINAEFHQIVAEYNLGKPLEQTLREAKQRLRSENFALFAAALLASHQSGGRLNETVERIAQSVLELQRLERKVLSETAQARRSALYMAISPAIILAVYYVVEPHNTVLLFRSTAGQILLAAAIVLNVVAYVWARVLLNPDL